MSALTKDRNTPSRTGKTLILPVAANTQIFAGAIVAVNASGNAVPGSAATTLKAAGRSEENVNNNPGAAGAQTVKVERGVFKFDNSATDPVTAAQILSTCYIVDDHTVAATNGTNTLSAAGKVLDVETDGVWIEIQ